MGKKFDARKKARDIIEEMRKRGVLDKVEKDIYTISIRFVLDLLDWKGVVEVVKSLRRQLNDIEPDEQPHLHRVVREMVRIAEEYEEEM